MTLYATLDEAKNGIGSEDSADDVKLLGYLRQVSRRVDATLLPSRSARPLFAPYIETRSNFRLEGERVNSWDGTFYFGQPLLSLTSVVVGTQSLTIGTDVQLYQGEVSPYMTLQLIDRCCNSWYRYVECAGCSSIPLVTIAGTWGYNIDWSNAWLDTLQDVPVAGITDSATSFTVTDVDAANANGLTPAISPGNLLQIDSEWLEVTDTDTTTNTVTVKRGVNGSTAAAHSAGTAIYAYQVDEQIKRAVIKQAGLEYATEGAYEGSKTTGGASGQFAPDTLTEFDALLTLFANM